MLALGTEYVPDHIGVTRKAFGRWGSHVHTLRYLGKRIHLPAIDDADPRSTGT